MLEEKSMADRQNEPFARDDAIEWQPAGEGVRRKVLTYSDGVMMVRVAFEAGAVGPPHSHPHVQCSLVERGVFDITIAGRTERLRAGDRAIEAGVLLDVFTPMRADFV
jgi:quercetin dioxygenase-like cupin family protein